MTLADAWFIEIKRQTPAGQNARPLDMREQALADVLDRKLKPKSTPSLPSIEELCGVGKGSSDE